MNRNPVPIVLPCHRIIGANGSLVGYGGGLDRKVALLSSRASRSSWPRGGDPPSGSPAAKDPEGVRFAAASAASTPTPALAARWGSAERIPTRQRPEGVRFAAASAAPHRRPRWPRGRDPLRGGKPGSAASALSSGQQPVAHPPHVDDVLAAVGQPELATQPRRVRVDGAGAERRSHAPHVAEQLLLREHALRVGRETRREVELAARERDRDGRTREPAVRGGRPRGCRPRADRPARSRRDATGRASGRRARV